MWQDIYIIESETEDNSLPLKTVRTLVATDIGHEERRRLWNVKNSNEKCHPLSSCDGDLHR